MLQNNITTWSMILFSRLEFEFSLTIIWVLYDISSAIHVHIYSFSFPPFPNCFPPLSPGSPSRSHQVSLSLSSLLLIFSLYFSHLLREYIWQLFGIIFVLIIGVLQEGISEVDLMYLVVDLNYSQDHDGPWTQRCVFAFNPYLNCFKFCLNWYYFCFMIQSV